MHCPFCRFPDSRVVDSREAEDGAAIRRRRSCPQCGQRFTTLETAALSVRKRSGVSEPFSRTKIVDGVRKAFSGRAVDEDTLARLAEQVEHTVRGAGLAEIPAHDVGLAILEPLRELDEVAYLRFASVYRGYTSLDDIAAEIADLRERRERSAAGFEQARSAAGAATGTPEPAPPPAASDPVGPRTDRELAPLSSP